MLKVPQVDFSAWKPPGPVTSIVAAWEPAVSNGENAQRGFGGRVYFYDQEMRPVKIKGMVIVYAFEEDGRAPGDARPNEGIVFDSKTLSGVYKKSMLGHSYNLWVPLDSEGPDGPAKKVSLIVRFIPEKGASVVGSQATVRLPGRNEQVFAETQYNSQEGTIQEVALRETSVRPLPERQRLTQERTIESNSNRPQALQAVTIR